MYGFKIIVDGDYACFTRPEMKVERVSYDVPTPGACEGLLKSVYWKPAIRYVIDKIVVFRPIAFTSVRRNEVKEKVLYSTVKSCLNGNYKDPSIFTAECRSQRAAMILKNVKYGIEFHFELTGMQSEKETNPGAKHAGIVQRRLAGGQTFRTPCLGCSEFPAKSITLVDDFDLRSIDASLLASGDVDLGYMLYKMQFEDGGAPVNDDWDAPVFKDKAEAAYYRPHMVNGVIDVARYAKEAKC